MTLLIVYGLLAICVSFLCSLLEAGLLSLPVSYVESMAEKGSKVGVALRGMKRNIDRPLAAILTLNTIAHTIGAAGVGAQAAKEFGSASLGIVSAVMTLLILVFSEIIPKTLGAVHAKRLAGVTAMMTRGMIVVCYPLVLMLEWMNRLIGYERKSGEISRAEVLATVRLGREGGSLGERELRVVSNVLALHHISVSDVLTPRTVVFSLPRAMTVQEAIEKHHMFRFARIPLYGESRENVGEYVLRFEIHKAFAAGKGDTELSELARPMHVVPEQATVADTMDQMLHRNQHIALVVDEFGGLEGIVTMEDLLETLLGHEIVDESDAVTDMRALARRRALGREH